MRGRTALILVDLQNAFCHSDGSFQKRHGCPYRLTTTLKACRQLYDEARSREILTIFTALVFRPDYRDAGLLVTSRAPAIKALGAYQQGSWDAALVDPFADAPRNTHTLIVKKSRYDPFLRTALEKTLHKHQISHLVLGGLLTNVCVEATARSAFDRDFLVTIIPKATTALTATLKSASLQTLRSHYARIVSLSSAPTGPWEPS